MVKYMFSVTSQNKAVFWFIILYTISLLSIISFGIPNQNHPFPYHMDEWHQLEAIRNTFKHGSPNIPGSAHGPMLQFLLSGVYLIPFILMGIINPFLLKSPLAYLDMQEKLFIILRLNTLLFGIGTLIVLAIIAKKYLKINPLIPLILFSVTPLWLALSNYYKYDIALIFWIVLSVFFFFRYHEKNTLKNFLFVAIVASCALATKIAALPMLPILVISFFLFTKNWRKKLKYLFFGIGVFCLIFLLVGSPDIFLPNTNYGEYLSSNLVTGPATDSNYLLGSPLLQYFLFVLFPPTFGHIFYLLFFVSVLYWAIVFLRDSWNKKFPKDKKTFFIFICLIFYVLSLIPLGLGASGNRLVVLLPFVALLSGISITRVMQYKKILLFVFVILCCVQTYESSVFIYTKLEKSPQQVASTWLVHHIKHGTVVGLENIPIYQNLPELPLKEYYQLQANPKATTHFSYSVIDDKTTNYPPVVLITEADFHQHFLKQSPKKSLITRLEQKGYKAVITIGPDKQLIALFGTSLTYHLSGLNTMAPITVYEKNNR